MNHDSMSQEAISAHCIQKNWKERATLNFWVLKIMRQQNVMPEFENHVPFQV